ncbi:hypothetical protein KAU11_09845 [Candidatus Babeliales bacterium]|nr:hypothetical protein [Candidatus Babeliales bacterium]
MRNKRNKLKIIPNYEIDYKLKKELIEFYKEGYSLVELSRGFHIDFSLILYILKRAKIKKIKLYEIYDYQTERKELSHVVYVPIKEYRYLEKFFPTTSDVITNSYFTYWQNKYKKNEKRKEECKHSIKHVRCAICGKILSDDK